MTEVLLLFPSGFLDSEALSAARLGGGSEPGETPTTSAHWERGKEDGNLDRLNWLKGFCDLKGVKGVRVQMEVSTVFWAFCFMSKQFGRLSTSH